MDAGGQDRGDSPESDRERRRAARRSFLRLGPFAAPTLGGIPEQTVWFMNNMGLNTFIAIVGISTGPSFVAGFQQVGWSLFLVGAGATTLPLVLGVLIGRYLFRFNDALTLGCVAGARTTTAALGAVEDTIGSNVPSLGYTITYAIGNTLLIIWGVVLVLLLA